MHQNSNTQLHSVSNQPKQINSTLTSNTKTFNTLDKEKGANSFVPDAEYIRWIALKGKVSIKVLRKQEQEQERRIGDLTVEKVGQYGAEAIEMAEKMPEMIVFLLEHPEELKKLPGHVQKAMLNYVEHVGDNIEVIGKGLVTNNPEAIEAQAQAQAESDLLADLITSYIGAGIGKVGVIGGKLVVKKTAELANKLNKVGDGVDIPVEKAPDFDSQSASTISQRNDLDTKVESDSQHSKIEEAEQEKLAKGTNTENQGQGPPNSDEIIKVTRESVQAKLDKLPDGQGSHYTIRHNQDGTFSIVRKKASASDKLNMTEEGGLFSPIKTKSDSVGSDNQKKGQETEDYVAKELGDDFDAQISFKDGIEVKGNPQGSVRPDFCSLDRSCSIEVKNYDLSRSGGPNSLVNNIAEQAIKRAEHLPSEMKQTVKIDLRGQNISAVQKISIMKNIVERSNGTIDIKSIRFITE